MSSSQTSCLYEFEGFVLDPLQRVVRTLADGQMLRLTARAFDALHLLVSRHGQLVDKETLINALWPKVVVEENNLAQIIHLLRESLGEKPGEHRFIATSPGRGYRFVAAVTEVPRSSASSVSTPSTIAPKELEERVPAAMSVAAELVVTEKVGTVNKLSRPLLRWGAAALALFLVAGAWWIGQRNGTAKTASAQQPAAVAVLPFVNLTGDASKDYLGEGMAEELINTLAKVPGLKVPARTSSFSYKGRNVDARQIAKELGVGMIVEGSVRSADNQIRITAQLINAEDGLHLWSETYDESFTNLFKLQDKLANQIATALHANLSNDGVITVASKPPTQDVEAYRLYLQGTALLERPTLANVEQALNLFQQAIDRDAKFARAYEGKASGHLALIGLLQPEQPAMLAAEQASQQALALDSGSARALSNLAFINMRHGRWLDGEQQSQASVNLNPADALVHIIRANTKNRAGKLREALQEVRKAYELAPSNAAVVGTLASFLAARGLDVDAHKYGQLALSLGMTRDQVGFRQQLYFELLRAKRYNEAATQMSSVLNPADPEQARTIEMIKATYAALADPGKRAAALATYARLYPHTSGIVQRTTSLSDRVLVNCIGGAHGLAMMGELDIAYQLANHCLDTGASSGYASSTVRLWLPEMRPFRRDPRFHAYVSRFGDLMDYYKKYGPPDDCDLKDGKLTCH